jgi:hypothetical protein
VVKSGGGALGRGHRLNRGWQSAVGGVGEAKLRRRGGGEAEAGDQGGRKEEEEPVTH